jgi:thiamine-monophosphate kinase
MGDIELQHNARHELLAVSADSLVEGTHFLANTSADDVACKSLAVNLSDMAAMGAEPVSVALALSCPATADLWQQAFITSFTQHCLDYSLSLMDSTISVGHLNISVQIIGRVPAHQALRRSAAKPGDGIYVSGTLGDAGLGLHIATGKCTVHNDEQQNYLLSRLHRPTPRIQLGLALRDVSLCAIDISDGLAGDLEHICKASEVGMHIETQRLPRSTALRENCSDEQALHNALSAGDDYELCFTAPQNAHNQIMTISEQQQLQLTQIGRVEEHLGLRFRDNQDRVIPAPAAYQHFQSETSEMSECTPEPKL